MMQQILKIKQKFIKDQHLNEIAKQSAYSFGIRIFGLLVNYLFLFFVTKYYGVKGWGIFAICFALLSVASMVGTIGLNTGFVKIVPQGFTNIRRLYYQSLKFIIPLNIVITAIVFFSADIVGNFFDADGVAIGDYIRIASLGILPFSVSMINSALFRGNKQIVLFSFYDSLGRFLWGGIIVFILHFFTTNTYVVISGYVLGLYVLAFFSFRGLNNFLKPLQSSGGAEEKREHGFKELLSLGNSLFWTTFVMQGSQWATTLILGAYLRKEEVGVFDATNRLAGLITIILYATNSITAPKFAEAAYDKKLLQRNVDASAKLIFWTSVPLFLLMLVGGPFILQFLGYSKTDVHVNEYLIFVIILIGQLVNNLSGSVGMLMQMTGLHKLSQRLSFASFVFTTVMLLFLTPIYGLIGASIITGLNVALKNIISVIMIYSKTRVMTMYIPLKKKISFKQQL
jgi:O-antigen/teichoic acid export membrane protein